MPGTSVIGLQWGDEAKGKLVDLLTEKHEVVVRSASRAGLPERVEDAFRGARCPCIQHTAF